MCPLYFSRQIKLHTQIGGDVATNSIALPLPNTVATYQYLLGISFVAPRKNSNHSILVAEQLPVLCKQTVFIGIQAKIHKLACINVSCSRQNCLFSKGYSF